VTQGADRDWTILYVDDDPQALRAAERTLSDDKMTIEGVLDVDSALERLEEREYPVVMTDYWMPGRNGIQLLERLKHMWPDTVRILATANADLETVIRSINRVGVYRFVIKPWGTEEMKTMLRNACEHFELVYENRRLSSLLERKNAELRRLNHQLDRVVDRRTAQLLIGLLNALDHRDTETQGHSLRVGLYARRLAEALSIQGEAVFDIERGALLHDIGKIGVSDAILLKPGPLTPDEWEEMRRHTIYGYKIVEPIDFLAGAAAIIRSHHERYDGTGYPDRLKGDQICPGARIFSIIDTYDAMTSDRPYRKALSPSAARIEIEKCRGVQFDPELASAFLAIPQETLDEIKARVSSSELRDAPLEAILRGAHSTPDPKRGATRQSDGALRSDAPTPVPSMQTPPPEAMTPGPSSKTPRPMARTPRGSTRSPRATARTPRSLSRTSKPSRKTTKD
jgi:putative nucleotidyltransferase with HDIG domain